MSAITNPKLRTAEEQKERRKLTSNALRAKKKLNAGKTYDQLTEAEKIGYDYYIRRQEQREVMNKSEPVISSDINQQRLLNNIKGVYTFQSIAQEHDGPMKFISENVHQYQSAKSLSEDINFYIENVMRKMNLSLKYLNISLVPHFQNILKVELTLEADNIQVFILYRIYTRGYEELADINTLLKNLNSLFPTDEDELENEEVQEESKSRFQKLLGYFGF